MNRAPDDGCHRNSTRPLPWINIGAFSSRLVSSVKMIGSLGDSVVNIGLIASSAGIASLCVIAININCLLDYINLPLGFRFQVVRTNLLPQTAKIYFDQNGKAMYSLNWSLSFQDKA